MNKNEFLQFVLAVKNGLNYIENSLGPTTGISLISSSAYSLKHLQKKTLGVRILGLR